MAHYIRLFTKFARHVPVERIEAHLIEDGLPRVDFQIEEGTSSEWARLLAKNSDGNGICVIERNEKGRDELFDEEIAEFIELLGDCLPRSGADWIISYLSQAEVVYACQFLEAGSFTGENEVAPHNILWAIKRDIGGIIQADGEGFTNEDGYQVIWQFDDGVSGLSKCAVLNKKGKWTAFELDLGNRKQRADFMDGNVPGGARTIE